MLKVTQTDDKYINLNHKKKVSPTPQKHLCMKMNQQTLMTIGVMSASLGVIRSVDAFQSLKAESVKVKHPLAKALFSGLVTSGFIASVLSLFQLRYSNKV